MTKQEFVNNIDWSNHAWSVTRVELGSTIRCGDQVAVVEDVEYLDLRGTYINCCGYLHKVRTPTEVERLLSDVMDT
jgi:hypothetical protein